MRRALRSGRARRVAPYALLAAAGALAASTCGCVSRALVNERPRIRIERLDGAMRRPDGRVEIEVTRTDGERRRYSIGPSSAAERIASAEFDDGALARTGEPLAVVHDPQRSGASDAGTLAVPTGLPPGTPLVWVERVTNESIEWQRRTSDRVAIGSIGEAAAHPATVPDPLPTDWSRPITWFGAILLPPALLFDVVTAPVQFLVAPNATLVAWSEWVEGW
ncbi:MAG: hypothetical protein JNL90_21085 [Planctomycetes bacterium]|nr:hypothetical protein [Planctomycetota bacterium]